MNNNEDLKELEKQLREKQNAVSIFNTKKSQEIVEAKKDNKEQLVNDMFEQAVVHQVANNEELKGKVLKTAENYTSNKMKQIETDVDTQLTKSIFDNKKDACESYGFNETTTPRWAINCMSMGYSVMLAIWLVIGTFTFMPVIFIAKKVSVGVKNTWVAILIAILLYLGITMLPIIITLIQ